MSRLTWPVRVGLYVAAQVALTIPAALYPVSIGLPLVGLPLLWAIHASRPRGFELAKALTVAVGRLGVAAVVLGVLDADVGLLLVMWGLRLNIAEAFVADVRAGRPNAAGAILLFALTFRLDLRWVGQWYWMGGPGVWAWYLLYLVWNVRFVHDEFPRPLAVLHTITNLIPPLCCLVVGDIGFWQVARASSLGMAGCLHLGARESTSRWFDSEASASWWEWWDLPAARAAWMSVYLGLALLVWLGPSIQPG